MTENTTNTQGYAGQAGLTQAGGQFNSIWFVVQQALGLIGTIKLAKVVAVDTEAMQVDVHPLVNMMDGLGNTQKHGNVLALPYFRLQGGSNAVIIDPQVGDIGVVLICDRDISSVKAARDEANPGSKRRFDLADGLYLGGFLNGDPTNIVRITADEITIEHGTKVTIKAPTVIVDGNLEVTGTSSFDGAVVGQTTGTFGGVSVTVHVHSGVTTGGGQSGPPVA